MSYENTCVHYKGFLGPGMKKGHKCAMGVHMMKLAARKQLGNFGCALRIPCIRNHHDPKERNGEPLIPCSKLRWPTKAECGKYEANMAKRLVRIKKAMVVSAEIKAEHKGEDWQGVVKCPVCKGELWLRHSGYNGHVWGRCRTKHCLSWME